MQRRGARTRQKAGTALNYASSRSHAVFTVIVETAEAAREQDNDVRTPARYLLLFHEPQTFLTEYEVIEYLHM